MYAKHSNHVNVSASSAKASTKHLESCLEVIQGHTFWDHPKADDGLHITVSLLYTVSHFSDIAGFCAHDPTHIPP